jgi:hypothetical protein
MRKIGLGLCLVVLFLAACSQPPNPQVTLRAQDFGTSNYDSAVDVAANSAGVYAVGYSNGSLDGTNKGSADAFIRKYDGGVVWGQQFGTRNFDAAFDVAVDSAGNSYAFGRTAGALGLKVGSNDSFLRKYNSSGVLQWTRQFGTTNSDNPIDVAASSNTVYTVSYEISKVVIRKWNGSGSLLLSINLTGADLLQGGAQAVTVDGAGNVYLLAFVLNASGNFDVKLYKYTSAGASVAGFPKKIYGTTSDDFGYDLKTDSANNVYVTLRDTGASKGAYLRKLDGSGTVLWTKKLEPTAAPGETIPYALAVDASDNVYVAGYTKGAYTGFSNAGFEDIFALKYNPSGTRLWTKQFGGFDTDRNYGIAVSDAVYLVGESLSNPNLLGDPSYGSFDAYLAQLDAATGTLLGIDQ